jgi:predicted MFS family arabinose efflux permease
MIRLVGIGASAYVVSGVLPDVSGEHGVSLTATGQLARRPIVYAIGAPLLCAALDCVDASGAVDDHHPAELE